MTESPHPASWLRRVVARVVDGAIVLPVGYLLVLMTKVDNQSVTGAQELPAALVVATEAAAGGLLVWFVYEIVSVARWGRTLGKAAVGIKVIPAESGLVPRWGRWVRRCHLFMEQNLNDRMERLHGGETPPRMSGGLIACVRDDGSGTQRLEAAERRIAAHLADVRRRHTVIPGLLRASMRTVVLAGCSLMLALVVGSAVDVVSDTSILSIATLAAGVALSLAIFGLVGRHRGVHDLIAPTAVVRA